MSQTPRCALTCLAIALAACSPRTQAQPPPQTPLAWQNAPPSAAMPALSPSDAQMRSALDAADAGTLTDAQMQSLASHPLAGWLEFARMRRDMDSVNPGQADAFLRAHRGEAVADAFIELWLPSLSRRQDWATLASTPATVDGNGLRCLQAQARLMTGRAGADWASSLQSTWTSGKPWVEACRPVMQLLEQRGGVTDAMRWQRIDNAIEATQPTVVREAASGLPPADAALVQQYADFLGTVQDSALAWPRTERSRKVVAAGLERLAKASPEAAESVLPKWADAFGLTEAERGAVLYQIALPSAVSYEPDAARRLAAVPASAYDDRLHEARAREAIARKDWTAALAAVRAMPPALRNSAHWSYMAARMAELTGNRAAAQADYRNAAGKTEFWGFLAADKLGQPYALCAYDPQAPAAMRADVERNPALARALALHRIYRNDWAVREWNAATKPMTAAQRLVAVEAAERDGWFDRGVFGMDLKDPDEMRFYRLRFPIHHADAIRREAANNALDPAWVAAQIRSESLFDPRARSGANAMGLMQLLPSTGGDVARSKGMPFAGTDSLYDPDTNIALGSAYLRQLWNRYGQLPYVIAAYNAGPGPVGRWRMQRPDFDPDLWIETISYKETREYVPRVLSFSVLYDWRMNRDALRLSDRIAGRLTGQRTTFSCPTPPATATH